MADSTLFEILTKTPIAMIGTLALSSGLLLFALIFIRHWNVKGNTVKMKALKSAVTERRTVNTAKILLFIGVFFLPLGQYRLFQSTQNDISLNHWTGDWTIFLEEFDKVEYNSKNEYQLEFLLEEGELKGTIFNEKGREQGFLTSIKGSEGGYSHIKGKYGNMDGGKMKFELMMFPDRKTIVGKYRERKGRGSWKLWMSHKKD